MERNNVDHETSQSEPGNESYDYQARSYDPALARFTTIDPLAEKHPDVSPYAYCADNPVNRIDQNGMDWAKDSTNHVFYNKDWNEKNIPKGYTYVGKECDYFYDGENGIDCCHGKADGSETMLYHQDDGEIIGRKPSDDPDQAASDTDKSAVDTSGLAGKANMAVGAGGAAIGVKNAMIGGTANIVNGKSFGAVEQDVASAFGHTTGTYFKFFSHLGNIAGAFNAGYSAVDLYKNWSNGNYAAAARDGADITMTFVGVFGGPAGDIVSAAYFIGTTIYDKN